MYVAGYLTARCKQNVDKILQCGSGFRRNIISAPLAVQHESKKQLGLFWLFRPSIAEITIRYTTTSITFKYLVDKLELSDSSQRILSERRPEKTCRKKHLGGKKLGANE